MTELNFVSERELECPMFYIVYVPGSRVAICTNEFVVWDNLEEHFDNCDGSENSITSYIHSRLGQLKDELSCLVKNYPSIPKGESS